MRMEMHAALLRGLLIGCLWLGCRVDWQAAQAAVPARPSAGTESVVLIVLDGVRWQEVFRGMDSELAQDANLSGSWLSPQELNQRYGADAPSTRRAQLMPFMWHTLIPTGVAFGSRDDGSSAKVDNPYWFSYPGYNEILTGAADARVNSNTFGPNPNQTLFEYLALKPQWRKALGIYATWDEFHDIFNEKRSGLSVNAGREGLDWQDSSPMAKAIAKVYTDSVSMEGQDTTDAMLMFRLERDLRRYRPRVLFVGLGDSDNWAHMKRYDLVLNTLRRDDAFIERIYQIYQKDPRTRGHTSFIITTDHGRGASGLLWEDHGVKNPGSDEIWMVLNSPHIPAAGVRQHVPPVSQSQLARTVLKLLAVDASDFTPQAAPALPVW